MSHVWRDDRGRRIHPGEARIQQRKLNPIVAYTMQRARALPLAACLRIAVSVGGLTLLALMAAILFAPDDAASICLFVIVGYGLLMLITQIVVSFVGQYHAKRAFAAENLAALRATPLTAREIVVGYAGAALYRGRLLLGLMVGLLPAAAIAVIYFLMYIDVALTTSRTGPGIPQPPPLGELAVLALLVVSVLGSQVLRSGAAALNNVSEQLWRATVGRSHLAMIAFRLGRFALMLVGVFVWMVTAIMVLALTVAQISPPTLLVGIASVILLPGALLLTVPYEISLAPTAIRLGMR